MKYMIWLHNERINEDVVHFFKTKEEMDDKVSEYIKKAYNETVEAEGRIPNWVHEFTACKIIGTLHEIPFDGNIKYREIQ